ncbi:MAG: hypothetical protein AAF492_00185 [Verrucomicrobiota bacterium]
MKSPLRKINASRSRTANSRNNNNSRYNRSNSTYQPRADPKANKNSAMTFVLVVIIAFAGMILQTRWVSQNKEKFRSKGRVALFKSARKAEVMPILCFHCAGKGSFTPEGDEAKREFCNICFGTGRNDVKMMQQREMICFECHGMGRVLNAEGTAETCPRCRSRGLLLTKQVEPIEDGKPIEYLEIECDVCMGVGTVDHPTQQHAKTVCNICFGVGWNIARKIRSSDSICPPCGGMGQTQDTETQENKTCGRCKGWGLIEMENKAAGM